MPPRWFTITLDEFKEDDTGGGGQTGASSVASSDAITSDDGLSRNVPLPSPINDELRSLQESLLSTSNSIGEVFFLSLVFIKMLNN